jgi:hypothetical protein
METPLIEIELFEDALSVAALLSQVRSKGETPVCRRCMDETETIAGVLVIDAIDERWALCGPCWREMPTAAYAV